MSADARHQHSRQKLLKLCRNVLSRLCADACQTRICAAPLDGRFYSEAIGSLNHLWKRPERAAGTAEFAPIEHGAGAQSSMRAVATREPEGHRSALRTPGLGHHPGFCIKRATALGQPVQRACESAGLHSALCVLALVGADNAWLEKRTSSHSALVMR